MEKETEERVWKYFFDKLDSTKFTINLIFTLAFIFLIVIILISAVKGWIKQQIIIDIGIMLIGLIMGAILSRKNGS